MIESVGKSLVPGHSNRNKGRDKRDQKAYDDSVEGGFSSRKNRYADVETRFEKARNYGDYWDAHEKSKEDSRNLFL